MPMGPLPRRRRRSLLSASVTDPGAFEAFYRAYVERVVRFFTRRTLDAEISLDLTGETFALALEHRAQFRGGSPEEEQGWLFAIARNQLYAYFRRGEVERGALQRAGLDGPQATSDDIEWAERLVDLSALRDDIEKAIEGLTRDQAFAVSQRVLAGRSYEELSDEAGVSEQVLRARVSRGLKQLSESLDDYRPHRAHD
ncbi:MAG: RNA polymerase sigma factor [Solirubrobacteraceae bacterium]